MIDEITNVTPDYEPEAQEREIIDRKEEREEKKEKKTGSGLGRGVALGAAMAGAAVAGAAVAHAIQPGDADDVEEVIADAEQEIEIPAAAPRNTPESHHGATPPQAPEQDVDTPEQDVEPDSDETAEEEVVVVEDEEQAEDVIQDDPADVIPEDVPEYIEQPELGEIEVEIDETLDMDDPSAEMMA